MMGSMGMLAAQRRWRRLRRGDDEEFPATILSEARAGDLILLPEKIVDGRGKEEASSPSSSSSGGKRRRQRKRGGLVATTSELSWMKIRPKTMMFVEGDGDGDFFASSGGDDGFVERRLSAAGFGADLQRSAAKTSR